MKVGRDGGAWWAAVSGVSQSWTQLKRLSSSSSRHDTWASQAALVMKNLPANAGDVRDADSIPGLGRAPGGGHSNSFQYSCWENAMDKGVGELEGCWLKGTNVQF